MKKRVLCACIAVLFGVFLTLPVSAQGYGWYVRRNKEHRQPQADAAFETMDHRGAFFVDKNHGDRCKEKVIYLTFDAGYENGNVALTVDILKKENVPGAFFVLPYFIEKNPALASRIIKEGHLLCNHSVHHKDMSCMSKEEFSQELEGVENACLRITGKPLAKYFRPPEGRYSQNTLTYARECGYQTVFWSFAYADWDNEKQPSAEYALEKILENVHNGAILLLHPTSQTNVEILSDLIRTLKNDGYRFAALTELEEPS